MYPDKYNVAKFTCKRRVSALVGSILTTFIGTLCMHSFAWAETNPPPLRSHFDLYELDRLLKIELFMEEEAWDKVRLSWRGQEQQKIEGQWTTIESDYEHQPGDVVINGVRVENVGIRKKGFIGSLSPQRPALKIKFNKFVNGQEFLGIKDLTLNNNKTDPAHVRQYLAYKWFRKAGIPAPRCNFARVYINGKYLGIYSNVEPLNKGFLKDHFGSSKGTLYEATLVDFQPRGVERFEAKTNKKNHDKSVLRKTAALLEDVERVDVTELGTLIDLGQFINFWSAETILGHWDGYPGQRNNYFVYEEPRSNRLVFIPWGTDDAFEARHPYISEPAPRIINGKGRLCAALYANPEYRERYLNKVASHLTDWWDAEASLDDVEEAADLIRPHVHLRENDFEKALADLRAYLNGVAPQLTAELKSPPAEWLVPLPEERPEAPPASARPEWAGSVKSTFLIPFGRFDLDRWTPLTNESFLEIIWRGRNVEFPLAIGKAGYTTPHPRWFESPALHLVLHSPSDRRNVWIAMDLDAESLAKGDEIRLHKSHVVAWFGTSISGRPLEDKNHGRVLGTLKAELVDMEGVKYIKGTLDGDLASSRTELDFLSTKPLKP